MVFRELLQYCKAKAIADLLSPTEESVWRDACRTYSENFNTPLHVVLKMDPEHILLNNFEKQLEDVDVDKSVEELLESVYKIENPNYMEEQEQELQDYIDKVVEEEKHSKKTLLKKEEVAPQNTPSGGSVDFSDLRDEEG